MAPNEYNLTMTKKNKEVELFDARTGELGALMREYRESIGYSLTQTADALCLSETILSKLEDEKFDTLPEPPYIRGYLRNYAKLADKDSSELINIFERLRGASPNDLAQHLKPAPTFKRKPSLLPMLAKFGVLFIFLGGLATLLMLPDVRSWFTDTWNSFSQQSDVNINGNNGDINNPLLTGNMPAPLPIPAGQENLEADIQKQINPILNKAVSDKATPQNILTTKPDDKQTGKVEIDKQTKLDQPTIDKKDTNNTSDNKLSSNETTDSNPAETSSASSGNTIKIRLVFNQEVWLRIKNKDKKTVYEGQSAAGNEKELELERPLTFRVGNAQGISIFIDGKAKDITEYIKGSVANFTL